MNYLIKIGKLFIMIIAYLVPKKKKWIVYGAWYGERFNDNPKYLYIEASKDEKYRNIWITKKRNIVQRLREDGYKAFYVYSIKGIMYQLLAEKAVVCVGYRDICRPLLAGKTILQLWHGVPLKKIVYDVYRPGLSERLQSLFYKKTYIVYTSENYRDIYKRAFAKDERHLLLYGQPRNDIFYDRSLIDREMEKKLNALVRDRKICLYMPTHRSEGKVCMNLEDHLNLDSINSVCIKYNFVFLINKHYYHREEKRIEGYNNIIEITNTGFDSQYLLSCADVLVTDYSSCYIDFLLRMKPVVFYQYDRKLYKKNERELYFDNTLVTPGPIVENEEELTRILEKSFNTMNVCIEEIIQAKNFFYDGSCQQKVSGKIWEKLKTL